MATFIRVSPQSSEAATTPVFAVNTRGTTIAPLLSAAPEHAKLSEADAMLSRTLSITRRAERSGSFRFKEFDYPDGTADIVPLQPHAVGEDALHPCRTRADRVFAATVSDEEAVSAIAAGVVPQVAVRKNVLLYLDGPASGGKTCLMEQVVLAVATGLKPAIQSADEALRESAALSAETLDAGSLRRLRSDWAKKARLKRKDANLSLEAVNDALGILGAEIGVPVSHGWPFPFSKIRAEPDFAVSVSRLLRILSKLPLNLSFHPAKAALLFFERLAPDPSGSLPLYFQKSEIASRIDAAVFQADSSYDSLRRHAIDRRLKHCTHRWQSKDSLELDTRFILF